MAKLLIPASLQHLTGGKKLIESEAKDLQTLFKEACRRFPELEEAVFDRHGDLPRFVKVSVDGKLVDSLNPKGIRLTPASRVQILVAMAGG